MPSLTNFVLQEAAASAELRHPTSSLPLLPSALTGFTTGRRGEADASHHNMRPPQPNLKAARNRPASASPRRPVVNRQGRKAAAAADDVGCRIRLMRAPPGARILAMDIRHWREPGALNNSPSWLAGHVRRALVNALGPGECITRFLFTGTRGVGKTTIARILRSASIANWRYRHSLRCLRRVPRN